MKWLLLVLILILAVASITGYVQYASHQKQVTEAKIDCIDQSSQQQMYLELLANRDVESCDLLTFEMLSSRCRAIILEDPSLCMENDRDCVAISTKNSGLCAEATCKAQAENDKSYCAESSSPSWCEKLVSLDTSAYQVSEESCEDLAISTVQQRT